jgi:hypothetical protein
MRSSAFLTVCLALLALAAPAVPAAPKAKPRAKAAKLALVLADEDLPIWELRPLDRRVHVLTLDGDWKRPPVRGAAYFMNVRFRDGTTYTHRVIDADLFRQGEVRCVLQEYQLIRHKVARAGRFTLFVTERTPGGKPEVISNRLTVKWPLKRAVVRRPPRTKRTPPPPVDAFPLPDDEPPVRTPPPVDRGKEKRKEAPAERGKGKEKEKPGD